jgi:AbrB family looped-hinge helix DNA binding protein
MRYIHGEEGWVRRTVRRVSSTGRVTIPAEFRRRLGIAPGGRVAFEIEGERVTLMPATSVLSASFQVVQALPQAMDPEQAIRIAAEEHAHLVASEGCDG